MQKIKILWVVNELFPEVAEKLELEKTYVGGWVNGLADNIKNNEFIELHIATAYPIKKNSQFYSGKINFYVLPTNGNNKDYDINLEKEWKKIIPIIDPDVVHIHGTEYAHGLALMNAYPGKNYVVSIQGLVNVCVRYYLADLSYWTIFRNISFRDVIRFDTIWHGKNSYKKRGVFELQYIKNTKNIMGRTDWDFAHVKKLNPHVNYHFCNETLRESFYTKEKWDINLAEQNTIFLSQSSYPIKGAHKMLEALHIVKRYHPNVKLKIAGENILAKNKLRRTGFANIINSLIKKYDLVENINFIGILNETQMKEQYLQSHIFICPSSIENSPNSLGEAQILGVPSIASYVGGNHNLIKHGVDGFLYRFESTEILAQLVLKLFNNSSLCEKISRNSIKTAELRHNRQINVDRNCEIYQTIINGNDN